MKAGVKMPLQSQINLLTIQQKNIIKELATKPEPKGGRKIKLQNTAAFFQDVIESLTELKTLKQQPTLTTAVL
jgi:hypothetical protein